ncbi:MAG: exodeoxyribonuclease VII large subunit, partial [Acetobacteraceae bacterium]
AAAELAVPSRVELAAALTQTGARLAGALNRLTQERRLRLGRAERGLPDLPTLLGTARQRLDDRGERLGLALPNLLAARRAGLDRAVARLPDLPGLIVQARRGVAKVGARLTRALPGLLERRRTALALAGQRLGFALRQAVARVQRAAGTTLARLTPAPLGALLREARARTGGIGARLEAVSPLAVLARGYALVTEPAGRALTAAAAVAPGSRLWLRFADGVVGATADPPGPAGADPGRPRHTIAPSTPSAQAHATAAGRPPAAQGLLGL